MEKLTGYHIDQSDENPLEVPSPSDSEDLSTDLEQYRAEAQRLVDSYRHFFTTFAGDVSLDFKLGQAFFINLGTGEVNIDTKWFVEQGFSEEQILWACLHELAHFRDLAADPERMLKNFDYIRAQAKETGAIMMKKWEVVIGESDQDFLDRLKRTNATEQAAYKIHHTFYNIFDDIYVNNLVARRAPRFEETESGGQAVTELYRKKLFEEQDYTTKPRHLQFIYALLREEMVKDEDVVIAPDVQAFLEEVIQFQGKEYTAKEIVDGFIKPRGGRDTNAGQRYFVLQKTLEPIFLELLKKDLDEWEPHKPEDQDSENGEGSGEESGDGNPFDQDYKEFDDKNPDQLNEQDIKDWLDKNDREKKDQQSRAQKQAEDENKSAEEKAEESQATLDKEWCVKNNVSPETLRQFRSIEREIAPYLDELSALWRKIIFGSTTKQQRGLEGHFQTGTELDIQQTIEQWPRIEHGELDEVEVMKKMVVKELPIQKPELIRVRLVGDMSGSMDEAKRHTLQQCFVLILSSLREFNTYLNLNRSKTKSKLETDTEAWVFGGSAQKVKRLRSKTGIEDEQVEVVKIFEHLQHTLGATYDHTALQAVFDSLTPEDRSKIESERFLEILFEVTDGGSSDPAKSRRAVDALIDAHIVTRAFQIGQVSDEERGTFNNVWNSGREDAYGEVIGEKIDNLIPAVTAVLKGYLKNVQL